MYRHQIAATEPNRIVAFCIHISVHHLNYKFWFSMLYIYIVISITSGVQKYFFLFWELNKCVRIFNLFSISTQMFCKHFFMSKKWFNIQLDKERRLCVFFFECAIFVALCASIWKLHYVCKNCPARWMSSAQNAAKTFKSWWLPKKKLKL